MNLSQLREHLKLRRSDRSYSTASLNRFINEAYFDLASRRSWGWLRRVHRFDTTATASVNVTGTTGQNKVTVAAAVPTAFGKRILLDGRIYRVTNVSMTGTTWQLDHPLHAVAASPWTTAATVLYDEVALPRSTDIVIEAKLIVGGSPLNLEGMEAWVFAQRSRSSTGQPTDFSTIRKEPLPTPQTPPPAPADTGGGTGPGAGTYHYWMSFVDKQSGAESALSPSRIVTLANGNLHNLALNVASQTSRNDFLFRIYRSKKVVAGEDPMPYLVAQSTAVEDVVDDGLTDQYLGAQAVDSSSSLLMTLFPAPDSSYEVEVLYQQQLTALGEDNHRPLFDDTHHVVLLDGAEALMLQASDEFRAAQVATQKFELGIARMMQRDRLSQSTLAVVTTRPMRSAIRAGRTAERWEYP